MKKTGKDALLAWCRQRTQGYAGVDVSNFSASWKDGLAMCALVHSVRPGLVPWESLNRSDELGNLNLAFSAAEKFGVPKLLDAEDMTPGPPEPFSVTTYLGTFYHAVSKLDSAGSGATATTPSLPTQAPTERPQAKATSATNATRQTASLSVSSPHSAPNATLQTTQQQLPTQNPVAATALCQKCQKPASGTVVDWNGSLFHQDCFRCAGCNRAFRKNCLNIEGLPYCDGCGRKAFVQSRLLRHGLASTTGDAPASDTPSTASTRTPVSSISTTTANPPTNLAAPAKAEPVSNSTSSTTNTRTSSNAGPVTATTTRAPAMSVSSSTSNSRSATNSVSNNANTASRSPSTGASASATTATPPSQSTSIGSTNSSRPSISTSTSTTPTTAVAKTTAPHQPSASTTTAQPAPIKTTTSTRALGKSKTVNSATAAAESPSIAQNYIAGAAASGTSSRGKDAPKGESIIEKEMREQREKEEALRQDKAKDKSVNSPSTSAAVLSTDKPSATREILAEKEPILQKETEETVTIKKSGSATNINSSPSVSVPSDTSTSSSTTKETFVEKEMREQREKEEALRLDKTSKPPTTKSPSISPSPSSQAISTDSSYSAKESFLEKEMREQKEKEEALRLEKEKASFKPTISPSPSNSSIASASSPAAILTSTAKQAPTLNPSSPAKDAVVSSPSGASASTPASGTSKVVSPSSSQVSVRSTPSASVSTANAPAKTSSSPSVASSHPSSQPASNTSPASTATSSSKPMSSAEKAEEERRRVEEAERAFLSSNKARPSAPPPVDLASYTPVGKSTAAAASAKTNTPAARTRLVSAMPALYQPKPEVTPAQRTNTTSRQPTDTPTAAAHPEHASSTTTVARPAAASTSAAAPSNITVAATTISTTPTTPTEATASPAPTTDSVGVSMLDMAPLPPRATLYMPEVFPSSTATHSPALSSSSPSLAISVSPASSVSAHTTTTEPVASSSASNDDLVPDEESISEEFVETDEAIAAQVRRATTTLRRVDVSKVEAGHQGWLKRRDRSSALKLFWTQSWFSLQDSRLLYYKEAQKHNVLASEHPPEGFLSLQFMDTIRMATSNDKRFVIEGPAAKWDLKAATRAEALEWVQMLTDAKTMYNLTERSNDVRKRTTSSPVFGQDHAEDMLMEGYLDRHTAIGFSRNYWILQDGMLFYFASQGGKRLGRIPLYHCEFAPYEMTKSEKDAIRAFEITTHQNEKFILAAKNDMEMHRWLNCMLRQRIIIEEAIDMISF